MFTGTCNWQTVIHLQNIYYSNHNLSLPLSVCLTLAHVHLSIETLQSKMPEYFKRAMKTEAKEKKTANTFLIHLIYAQLQFQLFFFRLLSCSLPLAFATWLVWPNNSQIAAHFELNEIALWSTHTEFCAFVFAFRAQWQGKLSNGIGEQKKLRCKRRSQIIYCRNVMWNCI